MKIVMLPLDERPCNAQFPRRLFQHQELELVHPELEPAYPELELKMPEVLGHQKTPASLPELHRFLLEASRDADGLVVSLDMLLYGGLIPSRLHHESVETLTERLQILRELRRENPDLPIYGFQCIMRCPDYSSSAEEPDYYADYGKEIHDLGVAIHQAELAGAAHPADRSELTDPAAGSIMGRIPDEVLEDYRARRRVNKEMNLRTLDLVADGTLSSLVIPQDDAAPFGFAAMDQAEIRSAVAARGLNDRVLIYPGADEVGLTLLSRMMLNLTHQRPQVYIHYADPRAASLIPLYEGHPLQETLEYHLRSAGFAHTTDPAAADVILGIPAPADQMEETTAQPCPAPGYQGRNLEAFVTALAQWMEEGKWVTIGDNAYANGSDLELLQLLEDRNLLMKVHGYAGWNTSSNTVGTALAMVSDTLVFGPSKSHQDFLAARYVEDAGHCSYARAYVGARLPEGMDMSDVREVDGLAAAMERDALIDFITTHLPKEAPYIHLTKVELPWNRMFEVDVEVRYEKNP